MRELRAAMREGTKATLHSAARFPKRHPFLIAGLCTGLCIIFLGFGLVEVSRQVEVVHKETRTLSSDAAVCGRSSLRNQELATMCARRFRIALLNCRKSIRCRNAWLNVGFPPTVRRALVHAKGGGRQSPALLPGQHAGGGRPSKPPTHTQPHKAHAPPVQTPAPAPTSTPAPTLQVPQLPAPSNPGEPAKAQGGGVGLELCTTLPTVPACVKAGISEK